MGGTNVVVWSSLAAFLLAMVRANELISGHYCLAESFDVTCPQGHVILMERALFGRMASGRCISEVHLGCSHNVLPYLDNHCTGHRRCNIDVNALVKVAEPCNRDYKSYLDAAYQCVPVVDNSDCSKSISLKESEGFIVGTAVDTVSPLGHMPHRQCSYTVQVPAGQHIKLYLYSTTYGRQEATGSDGDRRRCRDRVTVQDERSSQSLHPCEQSSNEKRLNHVFTSHSNSLVVSINAVPRRPHSEINNSKFVIKYTAVGCADITPPRHGRVERDGDHAVVRCNVSDQIWRLTCLGNHWQGQAGNCSIADDVLPDDPFGSNIPFQQGLALAIAVGVVVGTVIGALLLVCVYTLRKGNRETSLVIEKRPCPEGMQPNCYVEEDRTNYPALLSRERTHDGGTIYTHVCDTHGMGGVSTQHTLCGKDMIMPPPFSTSTTFKLTSDGCMEGSPTMQARAMGLDIVNNGSGCNTVLAPAYALTQPSKKIQLYESAGSLASSKGMSSTDMGDGTLQTPMYFDLAEPSTITCGGGAENMSHT